MDFFLGVLKSYESESLESWILSSPDKITVPPGTNHFCDFRKNHIHGPNDGDRVVM